MSRRTNSRPPEVEMSDLSAGLTNPSSSSAHSSTHIPTFSRQQNFESDAAALRVLPMRTVPLAILIQSFLVVVVLIVAVCVSTLIYSYAMNTINPITARYCKALSQDVADGAAMIIRDASNAIDFVHTETDFLTATIEDILVQCQEVSAWLFESIYFANDSIIIAAEGYKLLHIRHLPSQSGWSERASFLPGHEQHGQDDVETQISEFNFTLRSWYQNVSLGRTQWTSVYNFYPSGKPGMTVSFRGALGVLAVDYSMVYLERLMRDEAMMDYVTNLHVSPLSPLHPEVGLFDTRTRKWVVKSIESKVLGRIPNAQLPTNRWSNCSTKMTVDDVDYFSYCIPVLAEGDNMDFVAVTVLVENSVLSYLYIAIRDVVLLAGGAAVVILLFSAFLVRLTARPFSALSKRMREVSHMNLNLKKMERARFRELDEMQLAFEEMVRQLEQLKQYLPDTVDDSTTTEGSFGSPKSGTSGSDRYSFADKSVDEHTHTVHVTLTYVSRATSQVKKKEEFEFIYCDDDNGMFADLVRKCLEAVCEHPFQDVKLEAEIPGEAHPLTISNTKQLGDLLVLSPYTVALIMSKSNTRNLLTPVMAFMDGANFISTILFTAGVLSSDDSDKSISGTTFVCLYFFALVGNLLICLMLLRDASEQEKMHRWIGQSPIEVGITLFMSMFNTQNLQLCWSNLRLRRLIRFNAPNSSELMRRCVVWSLFGFVFCDMMQLSFKVYIIRKAALTKTNIISLITSSMSMMFNLIKKFAVLSLWQNVKVIEGMSTTRQRHGVAEHRSCPLRVRPVSLLLIVHQPPRDIFPSSFHVGVELNRMYELVFAITKHHVGAIVSFSNGEIVVAFNALRSIPHHTIEAVKCAVSCATALHAIGIVTASCVATLDCPVGTLGSSSRRSFHCFAATRRMHRIVALAGWVNADILCTKCVHDELVLNPGSFQTALIDQLYDCSESNVYEVLYDGKPVERNKAPTRFRALGKLTSGLSMRNDVAPAFLEKFVADVKSRLHKTTRTIDAEERAAAAERAALEAAEAAGKASTGVAAAVTKLLGSIQNPQARREKKRKEDPDQMVVIKEKVGGKKVTIAPSAI